MSPAAARWTRSLAGVFAYNLAASVVFVLFLGRRTNASAGQVGLLLALAPPLLTAAMLLNDHFVVVRTRSKPFWSALLIRTSLLCLVIALAILTSVQLVLALCYGAGTAVRWVNIVLSDRDFQAGILYMVALVLVYEVFSGLTQKMGPGIMLNWLLGRYHRPREERRIFMFLDLRDSTRLAESLGNLEFSALVRDAFAALAKPLLDHRAEVSHFIGDEVVVSWKEPAGLQDAACVRCFFAVRQAIQRRENLFLARYGVVPSFKAGMHLGPVVATEVGAVKSEIVFHGDVLNTASRLQEQCREESADLLISASLADALKGSCDLNFDRIGPRSLKGKGEPVEVVRVSEGLPAEPVPTLAGMP